MSRVAARVAVALAMAAGGTPVSAGAQQAPPTEADLVRRIDSLLAAVPDTREYERREALAKAARREEWERRVGVSDATLDTVRVGPLTVIAPPDQLDEAADLYRRAWSRYAASVTDSSVLLGDIAFGFQISSRGFVMRNTDTWQAIRVRPWTTDVERQVLAVGAIAAVLGRRMPEDLGSWAGAVPLLGDRPGKRPTFRWPAVYERAYRYLAIQPARSASLCFDGDVDRCVMALGLDEDASWEDLYTMEEIRALVTHFGPARSQGEQQERWSCLTEGDDAACITVVLDVDPSASIPLPRRVRSSLLRYALEAGGEGAFSRLFSGDDTTISERLEDASGMGVHELVEAWRSRVIASRPDVIAGMPLSVAVALAWIGLMSFLGLRSTRWRIG
ncbi:MAG: hypothetical protein BMS9Abin29_0701 [Gemmatimonadota bacterium]|nr:MAG: hypothetical protein BMS9Abin29_0701 [Gemmatimonadota bacterium]